ncbi:MAG: hypothetical protein JNM30_06340 [Rhodospirillales bacterium]|nr:hypothetical protein [Rhodospirillales bacterium]
MSQDHFPRRRFLGLGVALAAGATGARVAQGFEIQDAPPATRELYRLACEAPAKHVQLLAEIDAQLAGRHLSAAEIQAIKARATCPLCGCALTQADHAVPGDKPASDTSL